MDPLTAMLFLTQAAKLANTLTEQIGTKNLTPEEALEAWQKQAGSWSAGKDMWFATPRGG